MAEQNRNGRYVNMKLQKRLTAMLLAVVILLALNGCGSGNQSQPAAPAATTAKQIPAEKILEKANKYISDGNGKLDAYLAALDELAQLQDDAAKDETTAKFLLETANTCMELIEAERKGIYRPDEIQGYVDYLLPVIKMLTNASNQSLEQEKTELLINMGVLIMELNDMQQGISFWKENSTATMDILLEAIEIFQTGKNVQAIRYLRENLENYAEYEFWVWRSFGTSQQYDLVSELDGLKAYGMIVNNDLTTDGNWISESNLGKYWRGTIDNQNSVSINSQDIQLLKENCGKEAAGKVLILNRVRPYNSQESVVCIDSHNYYLPEAWIPERIEEISYILLFDTDYEETGRKFNVGTSLIKEISQITLYSVEQSQPLYQSEKKASVILPMVNLTYQGEPPEYYCPDHPDMAEAAEQALNRIVNAIAG